MSLLTFTVFDALNDEELGDLEDVLSAEFVDEFNTPGYGRLSVPMGTADADLLGKDRVIRCKYDGTLVFSWFIETLDRQRVSSDGQRVLTVEGRSILAWLDSAIVFPQGGIADFTSAERPFNFASADGPWKLTADWAAPQVLLWKNDATARKNLPVKWPDRDAAWIWKTNPSTKVQRGAVNYFRKTITLAESKRVKFWMTCDNSADVYLNGTLVMSSSKFVDNAPTFSQMATFQTRLGAGDHVIAARVRNEKPWERYDLKVSESVKRAGLNVKKDSDRVEWTKHELTEGTQVVVVKISEEGTGLDKGKTYFVRAVNANNFKLATSDSDSAIVDIQKDADITLRIEGSMRVSASDHGLLAGNQVTVTEVKPAGAGIAEGDNLYLVNVKKDEFRLSATSGGTAVNVQEDVTISLRLVADQTAGFIMTGYEVNDSGKPSTTNVVRTDATWEVSSEKAEWYPALILKQLGQEAEDRGVYRLDQLVWGYTFASPSNGSWSTVVEASMKVGSTLLQVLDEVVDMGVDVWITPTGRINSAEVRGSDLTDDVELAIAENLLTFTTRVEPQLKTFALIRTKGGWATKTSDVIDDNGRRETFLEFGNTKEEATARGIADRLLKRTGKPIVLATSVEAIPVSGARPFLDFKVGDRITIPNPAGNSTNAARVLSIAMQMDGNGVKFSPELEVLS